MPVGKREAQRVSADDGYVFEGQVRRYRCVVEDLFASPLVDTRGAGAFPAELRGRVLRFAVVGPFDRDLAVRFFDYLRGFDHILSI